MPGVVVVVVPVVEGERSAAVAVGELGVELASAVDEALASAEQRLEPAVVAAVSVEASVRGDAWPRLVVGQANTRVFVWGTELPGRGMDLWRSFARPHAFEQPQPHQRCSSLATRCEDMVNLLQSCHRS